METRTWAALSLALVGIALAVVSVEGSKCNPGTTDTSDFWGLIGGTLLIGAAAFVYITRRGDRRWRGVAIGLGVFVASYLIIGFVGFAVWLSHCEL